MLTFLYYAENKICQSTETKGNCKVKAQQKLKLRGNLKLKNLSVENYYRAASIA